MSVQDQRIVQFDEEVEANIKLAAQVARCIVLAGMRQFDRFVLPAADDGLRVVTLERLCHDSLGARATWVYDPAGRLVQLVRGHEMAQLRTDLPAEAGDGRALAPLDALAALARLRSERQDDRFAMVMDAGLLFADPAAPQAEDFRLLQAVERFARDGARSHVLILRVGRTASLPSAVLNSPYVRTLHISPASRDMRHAYVMRRSNGLAAQCGATAESLAEAASSATDDWTLDQLDALLQAARDQKVAGLHDVEELARAVRIGTTQSPWAGERIRVEVRQASQTLGKRVIGQPQAVGAVANALRKAAIGLSTAHQSQGSQAPRAVFFFAGPTGTGKTELAKAVSQLVFGKDRLLRFDCGELRQEHAVARLIGAPPGYVGYDRGGELTEGIRARPNSVVLFDEIEKAHPRLLDTLLGVLDDGRLTSGQGETAYFGQSLLIFTSNLGMYDETSMPSGATVRQPRFDYETPFERIEQEVREAIQHEFVSVLGRPELLGRFGGAESIVVFDYLRDLRSVCCKFVGNIAATVKTLHGIELSADDALVDRIVADTRSRPQALVLGGRGIKPSLDRWLTDPLAERMFERAERNGKLRVFLDGGAPAFAFEAAGES